MTLRDSQEREEKANENTGDTSLEQEVLAAASLTDADRIRILRDLQRTLEAIRRSKTAAELDREEEVRRVLNDLPGRERYRALAESLE